MKKLSDFKFHIELHRERVVRLGLALAQARFPELNPQTVESFLRLHDHSKTMSSLVVLENYGYRHQSLPLERLFQFYGKSKKSPDQNQQLADLIQDINSIDDQVGKDYFQYSKLDEQTVTSLYTIEKIADLVDRSLDPMAREEFGHEMVLASEYFQDSYLSPLSKWLEQNYRQITMDLNYSEALKRSEP